MPKLNLLKFRGIFFAPEFLLENCPFTDDVIFAVNHSYRKPSRNPILLQKKEYFQNVLLHLMWLFNRLFVKNKLQTRFFLSPSFPSTDLANHVLKIFLTGQVVNCFPHRWSQHVSILLLNTTYFSILARIRSQFYLMKVFKVVISLYSGTTRRLVH